MRIAFIGTRGVPARYGGFETAVEEIGQRLVAAGHELLVYCRGGDAHLDQHLGMRLVHLPAVQSKTAETLSHTALSMLHQQRRPADAAIVFNAANAPLLPLLKARRVPVAVHVDGLEWQRAKWGRLGQRYYRTAEQVAVAWADALIADARGIQDYYSVSHRADTWFIPYGAPDTVDVGESLLPQMGLTSRSYHLVVARLERENNVEMIIRGYRRSSATLPLVVVGDGAYNPDYVDLLHGEAAGDPRIRLVGSVWEQDVLDQLYANAATYVHGHSVGGTNPSLLRAAGAGAAVIAYEVSFNREVLGANGQFFSDDSDVSRAVEAAEADPVGTRHRGFRTHGDVRRRYHWDAVARDYERLCEALLHGTAHRPPADLAPQAPQAVPAPGSHQVQPVHETNLST